MSIENKANVTPVIYRIFSWIVVLLVPVALALTGVRALMTPLFLQVEYHRPNFPPDPYGFTTQERLHWAQLSMDYLLNSADVSFVGDLRFQSGAPVFNERELSHFVDVKKELRLVMWVWYISLAGLLGLGIWAWRGNWWTNYQRGLSRGGWLTVILMVLILVFVVLGFGVFFVAFHNIFFPPGTWMFEYTDTFIRLFPEVFWQDIFIYLGVFSLVVGLALGFGFRKRIG